MEGYSICDDCYHLDFCREKTGVDNVLYCPNYLKTTLKTYLESMTTTDKCCICEEEIPTNKNELVYMVPICQDSERLFLPIHKVCRKCYDKEIAPSIYWEH